MIGMYEVMDMFGLINTDEFGYKSYSDEAVEFATQILVQRGLQRFVSVLWN